MPRSCSSAPREKLPPPMTTAICAPDLTTAAICRATVSTTSGSTPTAPPPNISPQFGAAEEIAAADDHRHLRSGLDDRGDLPCHGLDHIGIDPDGAAAEHLAAVRRRGRNCRRR